jgi:predicted Zn-dependent protease
LVNIRWFKPDLYQGLTVAGAIALGVQLWQRDGVGMVVAGGLTALAAQQIWRGYQSNEREIEADAQAIKVAVRRGYEQKEAIQALLTAIENASRIENRTTLSFNELLRCQNLRLMLNSQATPDPSLSRNF